MKILPTLDNPPRKLNLENNILKTHKYKLLRLFCEKNVPSNQLQKYKVENKRKQKELFISRIHQEMEEMKDDPVEFDNTMKEIGKMHKKKRQQKVEVTTMNTYFEQQTQKQLKYGFKGLWDFID